MPDICGSLEDPSQKSQVRFVKWYEKYLLRNYKGTIGPSKTPHIFLSGEDCYALRCAFLHQGEFGIEDQRARVVLEKFAFTIPHPNFDLYCNQMGGVLQLQVGIFCQEVCTGVEEWLVNVQQNTAIQNRMRSLATIHILDSPTPPF